MVSDLLAAEIAPRRRHHAAGSTPRGHGVLHAARARGQRDDRAAPRLGLGAARPPSRPARQARRRARARPERGRGAAALRSRRRRSRRASSPATSSGTARRCPRTRRSRCSPAAPGRDEREFTDPDRFDVDAHLRPPRDVRLRHPLLPRAPAWPASKDASSLEETLARFPDWGVDESEVELVRTSTVRGPVHVPITI